MNPHYTYLLIHLCSLAGPLALSFDKRVAFYKKWKHVFRAMIIPVLIFIAWDVFFTRSGVWSFSDDHTLGIKLDVLPLEEVLFFFTVPYCCTFIYECVRNYFPHIKDNTAGRSLFLAVSLGSIITGLINFQKAYTSFTFIGLGVFMILLAFLPAFRFFQKNLFLLSYAVILLPFLLVNGFLTSIPVVSYNNEENLGLRIFSFLPHPMNNIPLEDIFYGMLLVVMNIAFFEYSLHKDRASI